MDASTDAFADSVEPPVRLSADDSVALLASGVSGFLPFGDPLSVLPFPSMPPPSPSPFPFVSPQLRERILNSELSQNVLDNVLEQLRAAACDVQPLVLPTNSLNIHGRKASSSVLLHQIELVEPKIFENAKLPSREFTPLFRKNPMSSIFPSSMKELGSPRVFCSKPELITQDMSSSQSGKTMVKVPSFPILPPIPPSPAVMNPFQAVTISPTPPSSFNIKFDLNPATLKPTDSSAMVSPEVILSSKAAEPTPPLKIPPNTPTERQIAIQKATKADYSQESLEIEEFQKITEVLVHTTLDDAKRYYKFIIRLQSIVSRFSRAKKIYSLDLSIHGKALMKVLVEVMEIGLQELKLALKFSEAIVASWNAALVILYFISESTVSSQLVLDEAVTNISEVLKYLVRHLYPQSENVLPQNSEIHEPNTETKAKELKHILSVSLEIFRLCELIIPTRKLSESHLFTFSTLALEFFFVDIPFGFHLTSMDILCELCRKYPNHRISLFNDLCISLSKITPSKKSPRNFKVRERKPIYFVSALIMRLLQTCCGLKSTSNVSLLNGSLKSDFPKVPIDKVEYSFDEVRKLAEFFQTEILKKCMLVSSSASSIKVKSFKHLEFRSVFSNIFDDLLECLHSPEWPISELLLEVAINKLRAVVLKNPDNSFRCFSLQLLGRFASKLKVELRLSEREAQNFLDASNPCDGKEEDASCICKLGDNGSAMVQCDKCRFWYHFACVGVSGNIAKKIWLCSKCELSSEFEEIKKLFHFDEMDFSDSDNMLGMLIFCSQHLIHTKLVELGFEHHQLNSGNLNDARCLLLCQWNEEAVDFLQNVENRDDFPCRWKITQLLYQECFSKWMTKPDDFAKSKTKLSFSDTFRLLRFYSCQRAKVKENFDLTVNLIVSQLMENQNAIRRDAMKSLNMIIDVDPDILAEKDIKDAVACCLQDSAISVRKQTVDLVETFISQRPVLAGHYIELIITRTMDVGVSVRKAAVGILHNICKHDPKAFTSKICISLAKRMEDIKAIKAKVFDTFRTLWFEDSVSLQAEQMELRVHQIIEVVEATSNHEWLIRLFREQISKATSDRPSVTNLCKSICEILVNSFVQRIGDHESDMIIQERNRSFVLACAKCLEIFSLVEAEFLLSNANILATYLKYESVMPTLDKASFTKLLPVICRILERCIPKILNPSPKFIVEIEKELNNIIFKTGSDFTVLQSAVRCLSAIITNVSHHVEVVQVQFDEFAICLHNFVTSLGWKSERFSCHINPNPQQEKLADVKLPRALYGLGLICRFYDVDTIDRESEFPKSQMVCSMFEFILKGRRPMEKILAMKGFSSMWIRYPNLLLDYKDVVQRCLSKEEGNAELTYETLKGLYEMLNEERQRIDNVMENLKTSTSPSDEEEEEEDEFDLLLGSGKKECGIIGHAIELYKKEIRDLLQHPNPLIRKCALGCIQLIIQQGLTHPGDCIPYIFALLSDPTNEPLAKRLIIHLEKKYSDYFWNQISESLTSMFDLTSISPEKKSREMSDQSSAKESYSALSPVFDLARGKRVIMQEKFLSPIIARFNTDSGS